MGVHPFLKTRHWITLPIFPKLYYIFSKPKISFSSNPISHRKQLSLTIQKKQIRKKVIIFLLFYQKNICQLLNDKNCICLIINIWYFNFVSESTWSKELLAKNVLTSNHSLFFNFTLRDKRKDVIETWKRKK